MPNVTITIPSTPSPIYTVTVNNKVYEYPAGTEQSVPAEVADVIRNEQEALGNIVHTAPTLLKTVTIHGCPYKSYEEPSLSLLTFNNMFKQGLRFNDEPVPEPFDVTKYFSSNATFDDEDYNFAVSALVFTHTYEVGADGALLGLIRKNFAAEIPALGKHIGFNESKTTLEEYDLVSMALEDELEHLDVYVFFDYPVKPAAEDTTPAEET